MAKRRDDPNQLNLFSESEPPVADAQPQEPKVRRRAVGPAAVHTDVVQDAARLSPLIRLGTSSWSFPGWKGLVYDRAASEQALARDGLAAYAKHPLFRVVGIDRTYYAPIDAAAFARYAADVPAGFTFVVKAHEALTAPSLRQRAAAGRSRTAPSEHFLDAAYARDAVVQPFVEGLATRDGVLVFQFSPMSKRTLGPPAAFIDRLHAFLKALPTGPTYAVELRNAELLTPQYQSALADAGAHHCYAAHSALPPLEDQVQLLPSDDGKPLIARWMLNRKWDYEGAKDEYAPFDRIIDEDVGTRDGLATLANRIAERGNPVVITVNNKAEGSAPLSVAKLARRCIEAASRSRT